MLLGYLLCLNQNGALISESSFFDKNRSVNKFYYTMYFM